VSTADWVMNRTLQYTTEPSQPAAESSMSYKSFRHPVRLPAWAKQQQQHASKPTATPFHACQRL